ncbi:TerB family tellurite resistance protein [Algibacter mikhailovii]|uniref:TerB family tellurite resistance protein n=1 Tax=Algibacter mikhailovii TaxID=425498 RepID=UPI0024945419|nr:TerB family tellurite resistance protein [Algibacter mikhailovii]
MSFSNLFDSGFKKRNENHFASIVRVAMYDGVITDEEKSFLDRLAQNLGIGQEKYKQILKNYITHPINPPISYNHRLERLYDLARMVHVDSLTKDIENIMLHKIGIGLGFHPENVKYIVAKAMDLINSGADLETFIDEIKNMNR